MHAGSCESGWPASRTRRCGAYVVVSTPSAKPAYTREPHSVVQREALIGFGWLVTSLGWCAALLPQSAAKLSVGATLFAHRRFIHVASFEARSSSSSNVIVSKLSSGTSVPRSRSIITRLFF